MGKRKTVKTPPPPPGNPSLVVPRSEVEEKLKQRIADGRKIQSTKINSEAELSSARKNQNKWDSYNVEYLKRSFDSEVIAEQYESALGMGAIMMNPSLGQLIESFRGGVDNQITELESLLERLELFPAAGGVTEATIPSVIKNDSNSVFVVHGHDEAAKINVARFIEKLDLEAIILHEQPNKGQTIIEKFESNAANVGFAVILLTPDDNCAPKGSPEAVNARARQNVILELGYFCGALGRSKVCVLYKENVEIPSDYLGVVYTPLDSADGWHLKLAKEMKEAGLDVDLNKAM